MIKNDKYIFFSSSPKDTIILGRNIASKMFPGVSIMLFGDLGVGKTVFVKGFADGLGLFNSKYINSPTYNLVNKYRGRYWLYHIDLYRIKFEEELNEVGIWEILESDAVVIVEWSERISPNNYPNIRLEIKFDRINFFQRKIKIVSYGFFLDL